MSTRIHKWVNRDSDQRSALMARPVAGSSGIERDVAAIIEQVRTDGDDALFALSEKFDGVRLSELFVAPTDLGDAHEQCDAQVLEAIASAAQRIRAFHQASVPGETRVETAPGLVCKSRYLPINPVGLYVPGGSAPLVSTILMLAIPAQLAGCSQVVLCTPPGPDGLVDPAILATAKRCGVDSVFTVGGAQAIAAMAYGTESIPRCAKIFGPGNAWVTEAKRQVSSDPAGAAQDLPAGPSEVLVIADGSADGEAICWDLLSQAEHGPDSQAILISNDRILLQLVSGRIGKMAAKLPRADVLKQSLNFLRLIEVDELDTALSISNEYAPEHLILNCRNSDELAEQVTTAGSVFLGPWTPESLGDYCSGTNHVLPTYGYAKAYGGLSVIDFMRRMTLQRASARGLAVAGPDAITMAGVEGLDAHRMAVEYRLRER